MSVNLRAGRKLTTTTALKEHTTPGNLQTVPNATKTRTAVHALINQLLTIGFPS